MLVEAAKKARAKAKGKAKKQHDKPKVEPNVENEIDPNTGQPIEVTKPAKAMTGNPANGIIVYPNTGGFTSPVTAGNPMQNSQTKMLQNNTEKRGMLLNEYIDYARGVIVNSSGQVGPLNTPPIPTEADRDTGNVHQNQTGNIGMDNTGSEDDSGPGPTAEMGDVNQRLRRRAGKRFGYTDPTGVWGGDDIDYAHTTYENGLSEDTADDSIEGKSMMIGHQLMQKARSSPVPMAAMVKHSADGRHKFYFNDVNDAEHFAQAHIFDVANTSGNSEHRGMSVVTLAKNNKYGKNPKQDAHTGLLE